MIPTSYIISINIHNLSFRESLDTVTEWGLQRKPGFVCFANVHMVIEAYKDPSFKEQLHKAVLVLPDGKPIALASKWLYKKAQERVAGMDFMPAMLDAANKKAASIFLFGATEKVLESLREKIAKDYPSVTIAGAISPPFRPLREEEQSLYIQQINQSAAQFVFVALGCPKQEKWMAANYLSINAMMLGLGGAFPVTAGLQKRSPEWMQKFALEWLYRLLQEPRRMFRRYFYTNTCFLWLMLKESFKRN